MKKAIAIFAIAALAACGGASTEATTDTASATTVDTSAALQNDTSDYKKINEERKAELEQEQVK